MGADQNVTFSDFASLAQSPEVTELVGRELERVNAKLAPGKHIKQFRLIAQMLRPDDSRLTTAMKLKWSFCS